MKFFVDTQDEYSYFKIRFEGSQYFPLRLIVPTWGATDWMRGEVHVSIPNQGQDLFEKCHVSFYIEYLPSNENRITETSLIHLPKPTDKLRFGYYPKSKIPYTESAILIIDSQPTEISYNTIINTQIPEWNEKSIREILLDVWNVFLTTYPEFDDYCFSETGRQDIPFSLGTYTPRTVIPQPRRKKYTQQVLTEEEFYKGYTLPELRSQIAEQASARQVKPQKEKLTPVKATQASSSKQRGKQSSRQKQISKERERQREEEFDELIRQLEEENRQLLLTQTREFEQLQDKLIRDFNKKPSQRQYQEANEIFQFFSKENTLLPILMDYNVKIYHCRLDNFNRYLQELQLLLEAGDNVELQNQFAKTNSFFVPSNDLLFPILKYIVEKFQSLKSIYTEFESLFSVLEAKQQTSLSQEEEDLTMKKVIPIPEYESDFIRLFEESNTIIYEILHAYTFLSETTEKYPSPHTRYILKLIKRMFYIMNFHYGLKYMYDQMTNPLEYRKIHEILIDVFNTGNEWTDVLLNYFYDIYMLTNKNLKPVIDNTFSLPVKELEIIKEEEMKKLYAMISLLMKLLRIPKQEDTFIEKVSQLFKTISKEPNIIVSGLYSYFIENFLEIQIEEQEREGKTDIIKSVILPLAFYLSLYFILIEEVPQGKREDTIISIFRECYFAILSYIYILMNLNQQDSDNQALDALVKKLLGLVKIKTILILSIYYQRITGLSTEDYKCDYCYEGYRYLLSRNLTIEETCVAVMKEEFKRRPY